MIYTKAHLYLYTLFFLLVNECVLAKENVTFEVFSSSKTTQTNVDEISSDSLTLVTKEIVYNAPKSGSVNFVWYSESFKNSELLSWNIGTKLLHNNMCTPMVGSQGVFKVSINIPVNGKIYYGFWITKDKSGMYTDLLDWKSHQVISFNNSDPIVIEANYSLPEKKLESSIVNIGWVIFTSLLAICLITYLIVKKLLKCDTPISVVSKVLILFSSMFLLHIMARLEIIGIHPKTLLSHPTKLFELLGASTNDLLYIILFAGFFLMLLVLTKRKVKAFNAVYFICIGFAFLSILIAFTNITTVIYIGQPFNYEWLYYSDFLGSNDVKSALQENLSLAIILNLLALGLSLFVLSKILKHLYIAILNYKILKYFTLALGSVIILVFSYQIVYAKTIKDKGKTDNAILCMALSIISSDPNASFFKMTLSDANKVFVPSEGEKLGESLDSTKSNQIKNVLYIVLESTGAEYFDLYGGQYHLNQNLNKYENQAVIFDNMYAHAPATNKSLVSILGSIYPMISYKSLTYEKPHFKHPTISSILKEKGYATSFFSSASLDFLNSNKFLSQRGFDVVKDFRDIDCSKQFKQNTYDDGDGIDDMCLAEQFRLWLDKVSSKNFFSVLWTVQGHYPYFFSQEEADFGVNNIEFNRYLNIIKHNDNMIGTIMQVLKERQLDSSTLVVVTGDHGESFGQHNQYGHGTGIYEENLKVPLFFINPKFKGQRKDDIVSMKDLATTTLSALELDIPKEWQGRDIINTRYNEAFFFAPWSNYLFGYRKDEMKYIFNESTGQVEVYNLILDPKETKNLYDKTHPSDIENARTRIASWVQYQDKFVKNNLLDND